jgi:hypothetical protein
MEYVQLVCVRCIFFAVNVLCTLLLHLIVNEDANYTNRNLLIPD